MSYANKPFGRSFPSFGNVQSDSVSAGGHGAAGPCGMQAFRIARALSTAVRWQGREGGIVAIPGVLLKPATVPFQASKFHRMAEVFR